MKKVIMWIAIILVALIPTYIIFFQGMKTAVPEVSIGDTQLYPSMVRWVTEDGDGRQKETSPLQPVMNFLFSHSDPVVLSSLGELDGLALELEPSFAKLYVYDLSGEGGEPTMTLTTEELRAGTFTEPTYPAQADLAVEWVISDRIRIQTTYSFEVTP